MSPYDGMCFVLMPFTPELHYFYLYIKHHIQQTHNLYCERADDARLSQDAFIDTIMSNIQKADVIIADCTGLNPNVMYEIGLAHAYHKPVIPIMQTTNPASDIPSDLRHRTFILYQLNQHVEFLSELDERLQKLLERPQRLYDRALRLFREFQHDTQNLQVEPVTEQIFNERISRFQTPSEEDRFGFADTMMANIFRLDVPTDVRQQMLTWLLDKYGNS